MMRSFILLALIADNPAAAGFFDFLPPNGVGAPDILGNIAGGVAGIAGGVAGLIQPPNLREPATLPGSTLAKKLCIITAPTAGAVAGAVAGTIPIAGGILTSVNVGLNMVGVTDDVRCDLFVMGARVVHQHGVNFLTGINIDPNTGLLAPITEGIHHTLGVTPNENLQIVDNIFDQVAPMVAPMLSGGPPGYQSTNNVYGPPPPGYAPVGGNQNGFPMPGQQMQPGMAAAPGMGYGAPGEYSAPSRILHV